MDALVHYVFLSMAFHDLVRSLLVCKEWYQMIAAHPFLFWHKRPAQFHYGLAKWRCGCHVAGESLWRLSRDGFALYGHVDANMRVVKDWTREMWTAPTEDCYWGLRQTYRSHHMENAFWDRPPGTVVYRECDTGSSLRVHNRKFILFSSELMYLPGGKAVRYVTLRDGERLLTLSGSQLGGWVSLREDAT